MADSLSDLFDDSNFGADDYLALTMSPENLFSILETLEQDVTPPENQRSLMVGAVSSRNQEDPSLVSQKPTASSARFDSSETDIEISPSVRKKLRFSANQQPSSSEDRQNRVSHITVEKNRRKQMNEHLSVLRSLMPCFYVRRSDQASIVGGVVEFIKELQQVLQSLEAKKQRKVYSEVLSPRPASSPRPAPTSPYSPRINLPISPRTPQPTSPYKPRIQHSYLSPTIAPSHELSSFDNGGVQELAANLKSPVVEVEVKFSGANVLVKTISHWIPGQALKIITSLEGHSLEIVEAKISMIDNTMISSFTIKDNQRSVTFGKFSQRSFQMYHSSSDLLPENPTGRCIIGIDCTLALEELAQEIQQTFC